MDGVVAYILGKSYTKKSLIGIGALAGAPCQVQSINKVGKTTTITLKWEDNVGGTHTQAFDIEDGLDGVSVVGATINSTGNLILTLSDTNTIDCGKVLPQYDTMPPASSTNVNQILQYVGTTGGGYTNGYYYKCINDSGVYKWVNIKVQDGEDVFRYNVIPTPNSSINGAIIQYIGVTNDDYTNGYYYQCVESPIGSGTYVWVQKNVQPSGGGTGGDGVVDGYYKPDNQLFYEDSAFLNPITGEDNTIYVDLNTNGLYRYNGSIFIKVSSSAESIQVETMPTADNTQLNKIYQYIGITDDNYTNGYFYKCKYDGTNYYWENILTQDSYTKAEIGALSDLPDPNKNVVENINILDGSVTVLQGSVVNIKNDITNLQGSLADIDKEKLNKLAPIYLIGSGLNLDGSVLSASGIDVPIDTELSDTSPNPVQNKVITLAIEQLQGSVIKKIQKKTGATANNFVAFDNDGDIKDSNISTNIVPLTASASNKLLVASDLSVKADKVVGATNDDIALLDGTGNLKDSTIKLSDLQGKLTEGDGIDIDTTNNKISLDLTYLTASRVGYIPSSEKGEAEGVAELDEHGKVPSSQLPSYVDDVIDGYLYDDTHFYKEKGRGGYYNTSDNQFYEDSGFTTLIIPVLNDYYLDIPTGDIYQWNGTSYVTPTIAPTRINGEGGVIYISVDSNIQYRWTGTAFAALGGALQLGETSTTAYRGDRGKVAYNHSQITDGSNPHNTTADNIKLKVPISALSGSNVEGVLNSIDTELSGKADKVSGGTTNGHLAGLDANGNLVDSNIVADNVIEKVATATGLLKDDGTVDTTEYQSKELSLPISTLGGSFQEIEPILNEFNTEIKSFDTDLSGKQDVNLALPIETLSGSQLTVEDALSGINDDVVKTFIGTQAQWDALSATDKKKYEICNITDDVDGDNVYTKAEVDAIADNKLSYQDNSFLGAKNLVNTFGGKSETVQGVTFTINEDGTTSTSGQSTGSGSFWHRIMPDADTINFINNILEDGVEYILTGMPDNAPSGINISLWSGNTIASLSNTNPVARFVKPSTPVTVSNTNLSIGSGSSSPINFNGLIFKPMIRRADDVDDTFKPYSETNIQLTQNKMSYKINSILGAKNLNQGESEYTFIRGTGSTTPNRTHQFNMSLPFSIGQQFTVSFDVSDSADFDVSNAGISMRFWGDGGSSASEDWSFGHESGHYQHTFTIKASGATSHLLYLYLDQMETNANATLKVSNLMIRLAGDNDDTYQPYTMTNQELTNSYLTMPQYAWENNNHLTQTGVDLNDIKTGGFYRCSTSAVATTLLHCPVTTAFGMNVIRGNNTNIASDEFIVQEISYTPSGQYKFMRTKTGGSWGSWYKFEGTVVP